jgi:hypothetical protein
MHINKFYTVHRPKQHSAQLPYDAGELVAPQPTEIDLVRKLKRLGIRLPEFEYYNNGGNMKFSVINWRRKG